MLYKKWNHTLMPVKKMGKVWVTHGSHFCLKEEFYRASKYPVCCEDFKGREVIWRMSWMCILKKGCMCSGCRDILC